MEGPPTQRRPAYQPTLAPIRWLIGAVAVCLSLFQLYIAGLGAFNTIFGLNLAAGILTAQVQRPLHLAAILCLAYLLYPARKGIPQDRFGVGMVTNLALAAASIGACLYVALGLDGIVARQGDWTTTDVVVSVAGVLLVMEACRRVIGWMMLLVCVGALIYASAGLHMPDLVAHKGYGVERIATTLWLTTEGVFGLPLGVAATFVYIFVLFGAFLEHSGGGNFFISLAYALTGRFSGGPAKTSVLASGFMGSVSGSAVGNVVATGAFTIPMMRRVGYRAHVAGAIEAAASTGGQLMPPIMGAGAFLMAEFTGIPYLKIVTVAVVPAVLYYLVLLLFVHFEARKEDMRGLPPSELPDLRKVLRQGYHFFVPLVALVTVLLMHVSPMMAGFVAVASLYIASLLRTENRMGPAKVVQALEKGGRGAVLISVACAAAGVIVGVVLLTGQGLNFASLVVRLSMDIPLLAVILVAIASLVLGMGLPVTASYIVLATLAGPALEDLGVPLIVAHMVIFWYSQDANVTPPVSLASFAAAGVAGANPMRCAFVSWKLAKGLYIIPIVMVYRPLLLNGPVWEVIITICSCALGLCAFAAALDRFLIRTTTWGETALLVMAAVCLFWPDQPLGEMVVPAWATDLMGLALVIAALMPQLRNGLRPAGQLDTPPGPS